jgi:hypothetical protein
MPAGEVVIGVIALINLLLALLLARKVRLLSSRLPVASQRPWLTPGAQVGPFEARTVDGGVVTLDRLRGQPSLVGLFSTSCEACRQQVAQFAELSAGGDPAHALAVIVGPGAQGADFEAELAGRALVVREERRGPVTIAFSAHAFPGIYRLDRDGKVAASGPSVDAVAGAQSDVPAARR